MTTDVLLPVAALIALAWFVPHLLARVAPRSVPGLVGVGVASCGVLLLAGAGLFAWLYGPAAGLVWREAPRAFFVLSARAALVWAPVVALSVADLPRRWPPEDWAMPDAGRRD